MNVTELRQECDRMIAEGHGNKRIWLSNDDEGNGFHQMIYAFSPNVEDNDCYDQGLDPSRDIILG